MLCHFEIIKIAYIVNDVPVIWWSCNTNLEHTNYGLSRLGILKTQIQKWIYASWNLFTLLSERMCVRAEFVKKAFLFLFLVVSLPMTLKLRLIDQASQQLLWNNVGSFQTHIRNRGSAVFLSKTQTLSLS